MTRSSSSPSMIAPDVRQLLEHAEPARSEVETVDVHGPAAGRDGRGDGDRAQRGALAGAAGAVDGHVAVAVGLVERRSAGSGSRARRSRRAAAARRCAGSAAARSRRRRRARRARACAGSGMSAQRGAPCGCDATPAGRCRSAPGRPPRATSTSRHLPLAPGAEVHLADVDARARRLVRGPAARVAGLERRRCRPGPVFAAPRPGDRLVEVRRHRVAEDVGGVVGVGHAQRDAQVGVGAQVVFDDAGRALRGEDQVQAERAAALGDVDDAVDELGHLLHERGELVDHDQQARRGLGVAASSRARPGLSPSCG